MLLIPDLARFEEGSKSTLRRDLAILGDTETAFRFAVNRDVISGATFSKDFLLDLASSCPNAVITKRQAVARNVGGRPLDCKNV